MFLKNRWGFSNEDNKSVAKAENEKSPGFSYAENWLTDCREGPRAFDQQCPSPQLIYVRQP